MRQRITHCMRFICVRSGAGKCKTGSGKTKGRKVVSVTTPGGLPTSAGNPNKVRNQP